MEESGCTPLESLRCPDASCPAPMSPPIRLCAEGHASCHLHSCCPTCAAPVLGHVRHRRLEALARAVVAPCENRPRGCGVALRLDALQRHHAQCPRRLVRCPLPLCSGWRGSPGELPRHLATQHGHRVLAEGRPVLATLLRDAAPHFLLLRPDDDDDVFVMRHSLEYSQLSVSVNYLGLADNASNFSFSLELTSAQGHGVYGAPVTPDGDEVSTLIIKGEEFGRIFADMNDSQVHFTVKIRRNKVIRDHPKRKKSTKW